MRSFGFALTTVAPDFEAVPGDPASPGKKKYLDKGMGYFQSGKYDEAVIEYKNAIKIDPQYADAHYRLAQSLLKKSGFCSAGISELMRAPSISLPPEIGTSSRI